MAKANIVTMEFHVSREARDRYQFDETLFSLSGNVLFANFHAARVFAQKMNDQRDLVRFPEQAVKAGHINAMGLIDEILHFVVGLYREQKSPEVMRKAVDWLQETLRPGRRSTRRCAGSSIASRRSPSTGARSMRRPTWKARPPGCRIASSFWKKCSCSGWRNMNPAFSPFLELFDDAVLEKETAYRDVMAGLQRVLRRSARLRARTARTSWICCAVPRSPCPTP